MTNKSKSKWVNILISQFSTEGITQAQIDEAEQYAFEKTRGLNPKTKKELIEAFAIREEAYRLEVEKRGGRIAYFERVLTRIDLMTLNWK